jgi:transposase InsO family protein
MQAQEKPALSVRWLCKVLHVNRRWYYASRKPSKAQEVKAKLREAIEQIVQEFAGYGYRRVTHALVRAGWTLNHKRVLRLMREEGLLCRHKRRSVPMTDSHLRYQVSPNLIGGMQVHEPNTVGLCVQWQEPFSAHIAINFAH